MISTLSVVNGSSMPFPVILLLKVTLFCSEALRSYFIEPFGFQLESLSNWLLETFQFTSGNATQTINVCMSFYLLCALGRCYFNSWSTYTSDMNLKKQAESKPISERLLSSMASPRGIHNKTSSQVKTKALHLVKLVSGIFAALAVESIIPFILYEAFSSYGDESLPDRISFYKKFFNIPKYFAFLLANSASSIFWNWASCFYVDPRPEYVGYFVPIFYAMKCLSFFLIRRMFRNSWNISTSYIGYYCNLFLSSFVPFPTVVFSSLLLIFLLGFIGNPDSLLKNTIRIPDCVFLTILTFLLAVISWDLSVLPKATFNYLRSDLASSGSYILALYFFPFNFKESTSITFTFAILSFVMIMEIGTRVANTAYTDVLEYWPVVINSVVDYFGQVADSLVQVERYPLLLFALMFFFAKKLLPPFSKPERDAQ